MFKNPILTTLLLLINLHLTTAQGSIDNSDKQQIDSSQPMSIEERATLIVQRQLTAYNSKDIDAFVSLFAEDATLFNLGQDNPICTGKANIRTLYSTLFERSPNLHSEVVNRSVIGNKVIDYELITGRENQAELITVVAIYIIEDDLINKCYFIRK